MTCVPIERGVRVHRITYVMRGGLSSSALAWARGVPPAVCGESRTAPESIWRTERAIVSSGGGRVRFKILRMIRTLLPWFGSYRTRGDLSLLGVSQDFVFKAGKF